MFGFSPWALLAGAAGYVLAGALGWAAVHEYGVAAKQAAHDRAAVAVATAQAANVARTMQATADRKRMDYLHALLARAQMAYATQQQVAARGARQLSAANIKLAALTAHAPATACIRGPIPPAAKQQAVWLH